MIKGSIRGLVLALFIIGLAVTIALNFRPLYHYNVERYELEKVSGVARDDIIKNYDLLIDYNNIWGAEELKLPDFKMSESGRTHFEEARKLFFAFEYMALICGAITVIWTLVAKIRGRKERRKNSEGRNGRRKHERSGGGAYLAVAGISSIGFPAALGIFCAVNFDRLFILFHEIAFDNDYWIFDENTDPVIKILPQQFFMHEAIFIFVLVLAGGIACLVAYRSIGKRR